MIVWPWLSHPWAVAVTAALLHFLWQGTLLALLGVVAIRVLRLATPHARYAAWLAVFAVMAAAPPCTVMLFDTSSVGWTLPITDQEKMVGTAHPTKDKNSGDIAAPFGTDLESPSLTATFFGVTDRWLSVFDRNAWRVWQPFVLILWGTGVAMLSLRLIVGTAWLITIGRRWQLMSTDWQRRFDPLVRRMGLSRPPRLVTSERVAEPFAWQLWRPMVVLPASWLCEVPADLLEAVVAHELAHIRRRDLWVNLVQRLVETVLFFHPCVWWVSHRIRMERELCCDADAVAATGQALAYAKALELVALKRMACAGPQLAVGLGGTRMALLHRVKQVLGVESSTAESSGWSLGLAGLGVTAACWTALTFATPTVQGEDTAPGVAESADQIHAVAQRDDGPPPRGPRDGDRPEGPRGPRDGDRPDGPPRGPREGDRRPDGPPRDGDRPEGPRGPRDGDRPAVGAPRGPEGGPRFGSEGRPGAPGFGHGDDFHPRGGDFVPPADAMRDMMRAIHKLREEVQMLRRELSEVRGDRGPGLRDGHDPFGRRPGADNRPGPREESSAPPWRPDARPPGEHGPEHRSVFRREDREGDRVRRPPESRRPEDRDGDRGSRPEGREPDRPRPPEGRPGQPPRPPEGRDGDRPGREGPRPEGPRPDDRRPEREERPGRPDPNRVENEERPVSALDVPA